MEGNENKSLSIWTIYKKGTKVNPDHFTALERIISPGGEIVFGRDSIESKDVDDIRRELRNRGLHRMGRSADDDETILEVWI